MYVVFNSSVAQLVEQLTVNQLVAGSSPARGANNLYYYPVSLRFTAFLRICSNLLFSDSESFEKVFTRKE